MKTEQQLKPIVELQRLEFVSREPHAIATDGKTVWVSSRVTHRVDVMDVAKWQKTDEIAPPDMAWGMTFGGGWVFMTCGEENGDRAIHRYRNGSFGEKVIICPEHTGSHLGFSGDKLLMGQWYNKKVFVFDDDGAIVRTYDTPHQVAGIAAVDGTAFVLGTEEEVDGEYYITRVDLGSGACTDVALVPFRARGLAWGGERFWTNHREADQTVAFSLPD